MPALFGCFLLIFYIEGDRLICNVIRITFCLHYILKIMEEKEMFENVGEKLNRLQNLCVGVG